MIGSMSSQMAASSLLIVSLMKYLFVHRWTSWIDVFIAKFASARLFFFADLMDSSSFLNEEEHDI
jgi:hypothetical protein